MRAEPGLTRAAARCSQHPARCSLSTVEHRGREHQCAPREGAIARHAARALRGDERRAQRPTEVKDVVYKIWDPTLEFLGAWGPSKIPVAPPPSHANVCAATCPPRT